MGLARHRRLRLPVWSRLTWAWVASAAAGVLFSAYSLTIGERLNGPTRVALTVGGDVERFAPPDPLAPETRSVLTPKPVPALREADGAPPAAVNADDVFAAGAEDYALSPDADQLAIEEPSIVITIDGQPARNPGQQAAPAQMASLTAPSGIPAPDSALLQKTALGFIPKVGKDGRRAATYYARPFDRAGAKNRVAVIVGGLGLNPALTERAIDELPPEVTLAFAPYAKDLPFWTERARKAGHEIMVELPMEGYGGAPNALGPAALLTERTDAENLQRLDWLLSRFSGYFAATNYLGGKFSADGEAMSAVLARLAELGVAYVDDTGAARRALGDGATATVVNRIVTPGADGGDVTAARRDLAALEALAARNGDALGKTYAYDASIDAVVEWAGGLEARNIALAPASAILHARDRDG